MRVLEICLKAFRLGGGEFQLKVDQVNQEKKRIIKKIKTHSMGMHRWQRSSDLSHATAKMKTEGKCQTEIRKWIEKYSYVDFRNCGTSGEGRLIWRLLSELHTRNVGLRDNITPSSDRYENYTPKTTIGL